MISSLARLVMVLLCIFTARGSRVCLRWWDLGMGDTSRTHSSHTHVLPVVLHPFSLQTGILKAGGLVRGALPVLGGVGHPTASRAGRTGPHREHGVRPNPGLATLALVHPPARGHSTASIAPSAPCPCREPDCLSFLWIDGLLRSTSHPYYLPRRHLGAGKQFSTGLGPSFYL